MGLHLTQLQKTQSNLIDLEVDWDDLSIYFLSQVQGQVVNAQYGGFEVGFGVPVSTADDSLNVLKAVYRSMCMLVIEYVGIWERYADTCTYCVYIFIYTHAHLLCIWSQ